MTHEFAKHHGGGGGGGGVLKRNKVIVSVKCQFMMANYETVEFIAIMHRLIDKLQFSAKSVCTDALK